MSVQGVEKIFSSLIGLENNMAALKDPNYQSKTGMFESVRYSLFPDRAATGGGRTSDRGGRGGGRTTERK
jgi:hypothetical protein